MLRGRTIGTFTTTINGQMDDRQTLVLLKNPPPDDLAFPWPAVIGRREIAIVIGVKDKHLSLIRDTPAYQHPDGAEFAHALAFHPEPEKGDQGKRGPQGKTGRGEAGPRGPQGERGAEGPRGAIRWRLDYDETVTYEQGDGVRASDDELYISTVSNNIGNDPTVASDGWMSLAHVGHRPIPLHGSAR